MAFYVPLGPRGLILRLGAVFTRALGGLIYRRSARRRGRISALAVASGSGSAIPRPKLATAAARRRRGRSTA